MAILAESLLPLVRCHFMTLALLAAGHIGLLADWLRVCR